MKIGNSEVKYIMMNGIELGGWHYEMYKFLTKDNRDMEMLFQIMLGKYGVIGKTIVKFQQYIRDNRQIDFNEIVKACSSKEVIECKEILEELFLEPIDIDIVAIRMRDQKWSLESLIREHQRRPDKRIHRILNAPCK